MSDGELVRQVLAGRTQAYEELVRRWAGRITAVCHAKVGRADAADDLAQETLLRGFRALKTLSDPDKFSAWLCGIAVRACLDWLKAKERTQVVFSALGPERDPTDYLHDQNHEPNDQADDLHQLMAEVQAWPEEYRQVVMIYYYQDVTYRDVAQILGVSTATVNARLSKARLMLRKRMSCQR